MKEHKSIPLLSQRWTRADQQLTASIDKEGRTERARDKTGEVKTARGKEETINGDRKRKQERQTRRDDPTTIKKKKVDRLGSKSWAHNLLKTENKREREEKKQDG